MSEKLDELNKILKRDYYCSEPLLYSSCSNCDNGHIKLGTGRWYFGNVLVTGIPASECDKCGNKSIDSEILIAIEELLDEIKIEVGSVDLEDITCQFKDY